MKAPSGHPRKLIEATLRISEVLPHQLLRRDMSWLLLVNYLFWV